MLQYPECSQLDVPKIHFSSSGKIKLHKGSPKKYWKSLTELFHPLPEEEAKNLKSESRSRVINVLSLPCNTFGRRKSISLESIPNCMLRPSSSNTSISALATEVQKASSHSDLQSLPVNFQLSSLQSYKSIEMLSARDVQEIHTSVLQEDLPPLQCSSVSAVPEVPKRRSAFLQNCTVKDSYLIQQGKRLSGLPIDSGDEDEEDKGLVMRPLQEDLPLQCSSASVVPLVPKRRSAFLHNCMIEDSYLIQQGKRLSGLSRDSDDVSFEDGEGKEGGGGGGNFKEFFKKLGGMLKKVGSSSTINSDTCHSPDSQPQQLCSGGIHSSCSTHSLQLGSTVVPLPYREKLTKGTRSCSNLTKLCDSSLAS